MAMGKMVTPSRKVKPAQRRRRSAMDKYKPPSPYIEHVFRCSLTGRDPNPDEKRYERMQFWDEIMETHIRSTEAALRMSQELETMIRHEAKERNSNGDNQKTNAIQTKKEE